MTSTQLTIRRVGPDLARRLRALSAQRSESLNTTVLRLLTDAVGPSGREEWLRRFATWTDEDLEEFMEILRAQRRVDEKDWR